MTSFSFATLFLASLVGTALGAPGAYQPKLRVPSRELHVDEQQQHQERELTYVPPTTDPDLCAQAEGIKADIASNNVELAETKSQIAATKVHLAGLEANLENARKDQKLKTRYLKHLTEFPDMEAGIASLDDIEAALQAALDELQSAQTKVEDSQAELGNAKVDLQATYDLLIDVGLQHGSENRKSLVTTFALTTCNVLDTIAAECQAAQAELDGEATMNALTTVSDGIFQIIPLITGGSRRLQVKEANFKTTRSLREEEDLEILEDLVRDSQTLINEAGEAIEFAYNELESCSQVASAYSAAVEALDIAGAADHAAMDVLIIGDSGTTLDPDQGSLLWYLLEAMSLLDGPIAALDEIPANPPATTEPTDGASTVAITIAEEKLALALNTTAECRIDAEAECQAYIEYLSDTLEGTLALASNLEELQDDLHSSMQAQFTAMQALFATQTELTADSQEMEECSDKLVNDIAMVTDDNYVPITRN